MTTNHPILLGVNIDHVATLREVRRTRYPDPVLAVQAIELGGADGVTVHLREDRRHIQERDVELIQSVLLTRLNLEMAVSDAMMSYVCQVKPVHACFVPEKREELTTEGGLDVIAEENKIRDAVTALHQLGIGVSLFIDPHFRQIEAACRTGTKTIEIHTGAYAEARNFIEQQKEWERIRDAAQFARELGLTVNAGHGLNYQNVQAISRIADIHELNIGHGIIARALFSGLEKAVRAMKCTMTESRRMA